MDTVPTLIELLERAPIVLRHLLDQIPIDRYNHRRSKEKWSVTEWLGHWIDAQDVLMDRFTRFEAEDDPLIADYEPPPESDTRYRDRDLSKEVARFTDLRRENIRRLRNYGEDFWLFRGRHQSYSPYGTRILLGHMLNVDYAHLFGMEKIGLGMEEMLR